MTATASDFDGIDFFRARELYQDPYPYYEYLRSHGPVWREPHRGVVMVTGYEEAIAVYNDTSTYSNCNTVSGPFVQFPVPFVGDDVSAIIDEYRDTLPFSDQLPSFDPPNHTAHRGLLLRLITPIAKLIRRRHDASTNHALTHACPFATSPNKQTALPRGASSADEVAIE